MDPLNRGRTREPCVSLLQILVLAVVQGITEFLPISSSGHLVVLPRLVGWPDQGVLIDVSVHVGTLAAVIVYFRRELLDMLRSSGHLLGGDSGPSARLLRNLVVATLPVVVAGAALEWLRLTASVRSVEVVAWTTFGFALVLFAADRYGMTLRRIEHMGLPSALVIGLAQVLALVPGTSRTGITVTAARMLGFERREAARFSMLLAIPTILGAGILGGFEIYQSGDLQLGADALFAAAFAFATGLGAIVLLMAWLERASFTPFVVYRVILGGALLIWLYA